MSEPNTNPELEPSEPAELQPRWPSDPQSRLRRTEAVLFLSRTPLASRKLSQLAELEDGTQARTLVKELNYQYEQTGRAFHIKQVAGGYQMRTRPQFSNWIRRMKYISPPGRISVPALETLTVVAYRQPIIKAEIEAIRGVSCGEMLRQLLEKGWIKIAGRSENLGRPFLYATSNEFLTQFGLNRLHDLPRSKRLAGKGLPQWVSSEESLGTNNEPTKVESTPVDRPDPTSVTDPPSPHEEEE